MTELLIRERVTFVDYYRDDTSQKYISKFVRMKLINK